MICVVALFVFAVLGLFSAGYRSLAREAFNCVFLRMTLRPCDTGFDRKMKMKLVGKLMTKNRKIAGFVFRHFELLSWGFTAIFFASLIITANSIYNLAVYGTCDPVNNICIFSPQKPECTCVPGVTTCETAADCGPDCTCIEGKCQVS
jgi:hypothetical protein